MLWTKGLQPLQLRTLHAFLTCTSSDIRPRSNSSHIPYRPPRLNQPTEFYCLLLLRDCFNNISDITFCASTIYNFRKSHAVDKGPTALTINAQKRLGGSKETQLKQEKAPGYFTCTIDSPISRLSNKTPLKL